MLRPRLAQLALGLLATAATSACGGSSPLGAGGAGAASTSHGPGSTGAATGTGGSAGGNCPLGVTCVDTLPFHDERDTSKEGSSAIAHYACDPTADESGPEIIYRVTVPSDGFLSAAVYVGSGVDVDVDVHLLSTLDPAHPDGSACLDRGDHQARSDVSKGYAWVVVDTFVAASGPQAGPYAVDIGFLQPSRGPCAMNVGTMPRVNDGGNALAMPATGPIVMEAHLVTQEEPPPYPMTDTDHLTAHYALSQSRTGLVMFRTQVWAPLEGGTFYGAGIGSPTLFPVVDEGWYVNMYWTAAARPPRGTRMILRDPLGGSRAVVVAAGYETGPGDLSSVGGTPEETHFYMGTQHHSPMKLGIATDPSLPLGPRVCQ
jgi:hypothetical protein